MTSVKVKTLWHNQAAVRDFYIEDALRRDGLRISFEESFMDIPAQDIKKKIVARSKKPFFDKFSGKYHYLYYFNWRPQVVQNKLL